MSSGLVKGAHVRIIENENTLQRTPQYIGRIGIVKEAPGNHISFIFVDNMLAYEHLFFLISPSCNVVQNPIR
jgi:hypothetical protein